MVDSSFVEGFSDSLVVNLVLIFGLIAGFLLLSCVIKCCCCCCSRSKDKKKDRRWYGQSAAAQTEDVDLQRGTESRETWDDDQSTLV